MSYENPWQYHGNPIESFDSKTQGFVYVLECRLTGRKYIGKKNSWFVKVSQKTITNKKGEKKKKKIRTPVESDWKEYYGSSAELTEYISKVGKINIKRTILYMCSSKSEMSYYEAYEQFVNHALISNDYFNSWIMVRVRKDHLKSIHKSED